MANILEIIIRAEDQASKQLNAVSKAAGDMSKQLKTVGVAMTAIGVAITATMTAITVKWATTGDEIAKLAQKTGLSTEALSELKYAADLSGSSLSSLEVGIRRMQVVIVEARDATSAGAKSLRELGLSYQDLASLSPEQQFEKITSALADIIDPAEKAAIAIELFGRSGTDMLPMLANGSQGLADMRQEAHDLGIVFTSEAAKSAEAFHDSITRLKGSISGLFANIAESLAPVLTKIVNTISSVIQKVTDWARAHPGLIKAITDLSFAIGVACTAIGSFILLTITIQKIAPLVGAAFHTMLGPIGLITLAISALIAIGTLLITNWGRIVAFFHGPAALATYELKQKIESLSDTMISGVKEATDQMISNIKYEASVEKSTLQARQDFWKDKQYEKMDILDDVMLAEIKAIDPVLGMQIEAINEQIKGIDKAGEARQRQADEDRKAAIKNQLLNKGLSRDERADLERELDDLEANWKRKDLIDQRNLAIKSANLDTFYANKQAALDTATNTEIQSYVTARDAFINNKNLQLTYLRDTWLPQYQAIMAQAGIAIPAEVTTGINTLGQPPATAATTPLWKQLLKDLFPFGGLLSFQHGGIVPGPIGQPIPIIAHGGEPFLGVNAHMPIGNTVIVNLGLLPGDDISANRVVRAIKSAFGADSRRNSFEQVNSNFPRSHI